MTDRAARVRSVLAIGARIADAEDPLGAEARTQLAQVSGLSPEGIELALGEHLERDASEAELEAFLAKAGAARRCRVILSANVCTAALRAIAFAAATAPAVAISPSRRDPVIADLVVRALADDPSFARGGGTIALEGPDAEATEDELHVYGADETIAEIRAKLRPGVTLRAHGSGLGAAVIGADDDIDAAATALARDVVPFDQRGCLSPRFALVAGGAARTQRFAAALDREIGLLGTRVPRGELDVTTRAELARYRATLRATGSFSEGPHHAVGVDAAPRALLLAPAARIVHVATAAGAEVKALLEPFIPHLTSIGVSGTESKLFDGRWPCRIAELGRMQKPPFDGPVDLRPYRSSEPG